MIDIPVPPVHGAYFPEVYDITEDFLVSSIWPWTWVEAQAPQILCKQ